MSPIIKKGQSQTHLGGRVLPFTPTTKKLGKLNAVRRLIPPSVFIIKLVCIFI